MNSEKDKVESAKNIVEYWKAVERFTPPQIETKNKIGYIKSIQQEVSGVKNIPWQNRERFEHKVTPHHTLVYTVFLGVVKCSDITTQMKNFLNSADKDFDLNINGVSCLCSFQLNNYGELIPGTLVIPDYFVAMSCLNKIDNYPNNWISFAPQINKKFLDAFENHSDVVDCRDNRSFVFQDLQELLSDLIILSEIDDFNHLICNTAIIYTSELPVPNKFRQIKNKDEAKAKFYDISNYENMLQEIVAPDYSILNSFYISDLDTVSNQLENEDLPISKSLKEYLEIDPPKEKIDLRADMNSVEEYSHYCYLPAARWPERPEYALSIAQQIAVNIALKSDEGVFSVNGPPGTGKSTLLRDIISGVIFKRAEALSKFDNPHDAFKTSTSISVDRYNYRIWHLDESLSGYEMVIASTNNTAVENISKEIPRRSEVNTIYNLDYFSEIASYVMEEDAWGLGAAVLGNKSNRTKFFDKFWNKKPDPDKNDDRYGLDYLLNQKKPESDWLKCREKFLTTKEKFDKLIEELHEYTKAKNNFKSLIDNLNETFYQKENLFPKIKSLEEEVENCNNRLLLAESNIKRKKDQLLSISSLKPAWYVVLIDLFIRGSSYKDWHAKCMMLIEDISTLEEQRELIPTEINKIENHIGKLKDNLNKLDSEHAAIDNQLQKCSKIISDMEGLKQWYSPTPYKGLWSLPDAELQMQSPWIHQELQDVRTELFVDAMNLHKSFILNSSSYISNNMRAIKYVVTSGSWPIKSYDLLPHIWTTFFLVVPTISTTFASFSNLFGKLDVNSIGYLLVDEAGQSAPQVAAGAIYRAKRSIIVGDPLQIQPVVTIPRAINQALLDYYKVDKEWDILEESVQTLSDRVNKYGTFLGRENNAQWIGCPLRVHRRCMEPMFSVANKIAYDNLMIQATNCRPSVIEEFVKGSKWINVQDSEFDGNWSLDEGKIALQLLSKIIQSTNSLPSLYIISPFKQVAYNMKKHIKDNASSFNNFLTLGQNSQLFSWINKSIGTVHTFQGKQADVVIVLLGGNPSKPGAINWASRYPNILNVAITRAKNLVFVVGDHKTWSNKAHFDELSMKLPVVSSVERLFDNFTAKKPTGDQSLLPEYA